MERQSTNSDTNDQVIERYYGVNIDDEDDKIVEAIKLAEGKSISYHNLLKKRYRDNKEYWKGNQVELNDLKKGEKNIIDNRMFLSIETIVPIITKQTPEPIVSTTPRDFEFNDKLQRFLMDEWDIEDKMKQQLIKGVRNGIFSGYVVGTYFWSEEEKRAVFKVLHPNSVLFPEDCENEAEAPYIIYYCKYSYSDIQELFPETKEKLEKHINAKHGEVHPNDKLTVKTYFEDDVTVWIFDSIVLKKDQNLIWNHKNPKKNHFKKPHKPFIFTSFYSTSESIADDMTLVQQGKTLQDSVNRTKRQFDINRQFANGKYVIAGNKIDPDDAEQLGYDTQQIILENADTVAGAIDILTGRALDSGSFQDMAHSINEIDNVFGTHSTTRGERESQETATGRAILKQGDQGRLEVPTSFLEQFAEDYYNAKIQLLKVFAEKQIPIQTEPKGNDRKLSAIEEQMYIQKSEFDKKTVTVKVKQGSTTPKDPIAIQSTAIELAKNKMMSLKDMYSMLELPNPDRLARNAIMEAVAPDQLYPELKGDAFEPEAIRHILALLNQEEVGDEELDLMQTEDLDTLSKHLNTHLEYMRGIQVAKDIPDFKDLDVELQAQITEHVSKEKMNLEALLEQEQQAAMQQQAGMGMPSPAMAPQQNALESMPQAQTPQQAIPPEMMMQ